MAPTTKARLTSRVDLSSDVRAFTFEAVDEPFDRAQPGAHVDVYLDADVVRNYSLVDWDDAGRWVTVAVKKEPGGRGGSVAMHALEVGDVLELAGPRTNFPLVDDGRPVVLIGGGIGITPLYPMARALQAAGCDLTVHYLVRSRPHAALGPHLDALGLGERYHLHCDDVHGLPDVPALVAGTPEDAHLYVCGPEVLLDAVLQACPPGGGRTVSFERFAAVAHEGAELPFTVVLDSTGEELEVPADKTVLQVLREAGRDVDWSCSEGVCGTCLTDVLDGDVDHRDSILTPEEQQAGDCMAVCVSRARGPRLVLDL